MSTKSYTLIPYHLQDRNIQSWNFFFFSPMLEVNKYVLGAKKTIF
jgi:hypothetical protein